jgi:hypothetical protein
MPVYCLKCSMCSATRTVLRPIARRNETIPCGICGSGELRRDMANEGVNSTDVEYARPVYSDAAGVAPDQVPEHRRRFPDIPITDDGRVIFTSHNQRKRALKQLGFVDRDSYY